MGEDGAARIAPDNADSLFKMTRRRRRRFVLNDSALKSDFKLLECRREDTQRRLNRQNVWEFFSLIVLDAPTRCSQRGNGAIQGLSRGNDVSSTKESVRDPSKA